MVTRHDCQREVVPVATFVAGLKVIDVARDDPAIGEIAKGASDRYGRRVVDDHQKAADRKHAAPNVRCSAGSNIARLHHCRFNV